MYPTKKQISALKQYIDNDGDFSIYGKDGIYKELENRISQSYSSRPYCLLTNTGTSALSSAYFGVGIKDGDEVIVPTYTFISTVTPLLRLKAIPVFADVCPDTGLIDPKSILKCITARTSAIVVTHMWGLPCKMDEIKQICKENNLKLIEDASHAQFTSYKGKHLGEFGDAGAISVGARKMVSGGEGGFMITDNADVYMKATLLGHFNMRAEDTIKELGLCEYKGYEGGFGENYRIHPYSAVMINEFIKNEMDDFEKKRKEVLNNLHVSLKKISMIEPPTVYNGLQYGFKPKYLGDNIDKFLLMANKEMGIKIVKRLDTIPLHGNKLFENNTKRIGKYSGAKEYMNGRFSLKNEVIFMAMRNGGIIDKIIQSIKKAI